jgi:hypothetical protein
MPLIDLTALKREIPVLKALWLLGWKPTTSYYGQHRGACPLHKSKRPDRSRSLAVKDGGWCCHTCKRSGDAVALWAAVKGVNIYSAAIDLCAALGIPVPYKTRNRDEERLMRERQQRAGSKTQATEKGG